MLLLHAVSKRQDGVASIVVVCCPMQRAQQGVMLRLDAQAA